MQLIFFPTRMLVETMEAAAAAADAKVFTSDRSRKKLYGFHPKMTQVAGAVLINEPFKPALCGDAPVEMAFPVSFTFRSK